MPVYTCPHCNCDFDARAAKRRSSAKTQPKKTKPPSKPTGRTRVWRSMRQLRAFTLPDLVATTELQYGTVNAYMQGLKGLGYVRCEYATKGDVGDHSVYRLIRDTGPHAPILRRDNSAWDPNQGVEVSRD